MNFLKNRTALGLICIVLSLIICFGLTPLFNGAVKAQTEIVRMTSAVKTGEVITADKVELCKVGGYNLPENVIKDTESVVGQYAKADLMAGDYIIEGKLSVSPLSEFAYLQELDGEHQAISITIKSFAAGLSGKLEAGDIVSLIASDVGDFRETVAPPELRYVKVLAVTDGKGYDKENVQEQEDEDEKSLPSTITLLVLPSQARLLSELEAKGKIHCALVYRGTAGNKYLEIQAEYLAELEALAAEAEESPGDSPQEDIPLESLPETPEQTEFPEQAEQTEQNGQEVVDIGE